jgi:hypothetical protein
MASRLDSPAPLKRWAALPVSCLLALVPFASIIFAGPAAAQEAVKRVADDVYFFFDFSWSNSVFLATEEGVLLIDTRTHPREGSDLLDRVIDKAHKVHDQQPLPWHPKSQTCGRITTWGNSVFKALSDILSAWGVPSLPRFAIFISSRRTKISSPILVITTMLMKMFSGPGAGRYAFSVSS